MVLLGCLCAATQEQIAHLCPHVAAVAKQAASEIPSMQSASGVSFPQSPLFGQTDFEYLMPKRTEPEPPKVPPHILPPTNLTTKGSLPDPTAVAPEDDDTQNVTPWTAVASQGGFDYMKLIKRFGSHPIDGQLIKRIEKATNMRAHRFLRRGLFFSHRDLEQWLAAFEKGNDIYLYTGRGPSSESMHIGHMVPFEFTRYLQEAFGAILVIQMSDDEKYYFKDCATKDGVEHYQALGRQNAKDIIALGFDVSRTYMFSNTEEVGHNPALQKNVVRMMKATVGNQIKGTFGLSTEGGHTIGQMAWPVYQSVPAYSSSFPRLFLPTSKPVPCLVPMAIDQDPYFRLARDFAQTGVGKQARVMKPSAIHSEFLVGLSGIGDKMSASCATQKTIFLTDKKEVVERKVKRFAYSGGGGTQEEHERDGAALDVDVPYQYLLYFIEDDAELERIAHEYANGRMPSKDIKDKMFAVVWDFVDKHQKARAKVDDAVLDSFFSRDPTRVFNRSRPVRAPLVLLGDEVYAKMGCGFDRYFGERRAATTKMAVTPPSTTPSRTPASTPPPPPPAEKEE